jgi:hypothetical protein
MFWEWGASHLEFAKSLEDVHFRMLSSIKDSAVNHVE